VYTRRRGEGERKKKIRNGIAKTPGKGKKSAIPALTSRLEKGEIGKNQDR